MHVMRTLVYPFLLFILMVCFGLRAELPDVQRAQALSRERVQLDFSAAAPARTRLEYSVNWLEWLPLGDVSGKSTHEVTGLESDRVVFFRLAQGHTEVHSYSPVISVRLLQGVEETLFAQVNSVQGIRVGEQVGLRWVDRFDNESAWEIQRSTDGAQSWAAHVSLPANSSRWLEDAPSGKVAYRIRAVNAQHQTDWLSISEIYWSLPYVDFGYAKSASAALFSQPAVLEVLEPEKLAVTWPVDAETPAQLHVELSWDGESWLRQSGSTVNGADGRVELSLQTFLPVQIRLVESIADAAPRTQVISFAGQAPLSDLAHPEMTSLDIVEGGLRIEWEDRSIQEDGFWIERSKSSKHWEKIGEVAANQRSFVFLDRFVYASYRVRAMRGGKWSAPSQPLRLRYGGSRVLTEALELSSQIDQAQVTLSWPLPEEADQISAVVQRSVNGLPFVSIAMLDSLAAGSWTDPEKLPGRELRYQMQIEAEPSRSTQIQIQVPGSPAALPSQAPMRSSGSASLSILSSAVTPQDEADAFSAWKTLQIKGSAGDDGIQVSQSGDVITIIDGTRSRERTGPFDEIRILGEGGNDSIRVDASVTAVVTLVGGAGEDSLEAWGSGKSCIVAVDDERDWVSGKSGTRFWVDSHELDAIGDVLAEPAGMVHRVGPLYGGTSKARNRYLPNPDASYKSAALITKNPFFGRGPSIIDVNQGFYQDCPFTAYYQNIARLDPERLEGFAVDLLDGTALVALAGGHARIQTSYRSGWLSTYGPQASTWWLAMEKAWVAMALPTPLTENITLSQVTPMAGGYDEAYFDAIYDALEKGHKLTAFTRLSSYAGWLPSPNHAHSVVSAFRDPQGTPRIVLRNPYGIQANFAQDPRSEQLNFHAISVAQLVANSQNIQFYQVLGKIPPRPGVQDLNLTVSAGNAVECSLISFDLAQRDLSYQITQAPQHGRVLGQGSSRMYIPNEGYVGMDQFEWRVSTADGQMSKSARISVEVTPAGGNQVPNILLLPGDTTFTYGESFQEPGFNASDSEDGSLQDSVQILDAGSGLLPIGEHDILYGVQDSSGNLRVVSRRIQVEDGDFDGDGMTSLWELERGLDPLSSLGDDGAENDKDQDGVRNGDEFTGDTDPDDPSSFFSLGFVSGASGEISFFASSIRRYTLQGTNSLQDPDSWQDLASHQQLPGSNAQVHWSLPSTPSFQFYRVRVQMPE